MLAYNNPKKEDSREMIATVIKEYLPKQKVKMFELLGGGVGARFYDKYLPVEHMTLVEKKTELYNAFDIEELECSVNKYHMDIYDFFDKFYHLDGEYTKEFFNVINLDFCAWFYDNDKPNCTAQIVDRMFKSKSLSDNGLLFCTFQIDGWNLRRYKSRTGSDVPLTANEILMSITYLAMQNGYRIKDNKTIFENVYRSTDGRGAQTMLNVAFQVTK